MKKELTKKQIVKRIFTIIGIVLGCVTGIWIGYQLYILHFHFSLNDYAIVIEDNVMADAEYLIAQREFSIQESENKNIISDTLFLMPEDIFSQLVKYMQKENYALKPGVYILNKAWTFGMTKRALELVPLEDLERQTQPLPSG
ncbi:hypothetical protein LJC56_11895 [Christensenellaceae bacterium OttesenSCG-928-K19]|nr:hypothetical protein [Christensenellaceae bacterium OttesenSCG-928-K19]